MQVKSKAQPRKVVITINYHYVVRGRRVGLRKDIADSLLRGIIRRLERKGLIVVDEVAIKEA